MDVLLTTFLTISLLFAVSAVATGFQALVDPVGFSRTFGLPLTPELHHQPVHGVARRYTSLMGVRQLATGVILLIFAYQHKWAEMATILAVIGVVVAGTDGMHLWRAGHKTQAQFHAIPGALIAALAGAFIYSQA